MRAILQAVGRFLWYEVLRFQRLPTLLSLLLYGVTLLAILCAVARPSFNIRLQPREGADGLFGLAPARSTDRGWERLVEVADGWRRFEAGDREPFRRQRLAVDHFLDWFAQDGWWRVRKTNLRDATRDWRTHVREITAIAFHLDGLDATGDREPHAKVLEAALSYVEDLQDTGTTGVAVALACDERLLRQLLRHLEVSGAPAAACERWRARRRRRCAWPRAASR